MSPEPEPKPEAPRQRHRAGVLIALILSGVAWLVLTFPNPALVTGQSLLALGVVILLAAVGGIAFSWRRYFGRR
jgi:hypothetical protein